MRITPLLFPLLKLTPKKVSVTSRLRGASCAAPPFAAPLKKAPRRGRAKEQSKGNQGGFGLTAPVLNITCPDGWPPVEPVAGLTNCFP